MTPSKQHYAPSARWAPAPRPAARSNVWPSCAGAIQTYAAKTPSADPHGLTKRQRDVLELLAAGHSDTEIATALCISHKTANTHVCAIMAKLGVHNRTQAAAYAHQQPPSPR